jgi:hypothetical protein
VIGKNHNWNLFFSEFYSACGNMERNIPVIKSSTFIQDYNEISWGTYFCISTYKVTAISSGICTTVICSHPSFIFM